MTMPIAFEVDGNMGYDFGEVDCFVEDVDRLVEAVRAVLRHQHEWGDGSPYQTLADAVGEIDGWRPPPT